MMHLVALTLLLMLLPLSTAHAGVIDLQFVHTFDNCEDIGHAPGGLACNLYRFDNGFTARPLPLSLGFYLTGNAGIDTVDLQRGLRIDTNGPAFDLLSWTGIMRFGLTPTALPVLLTSSAGGRAILNPRIDLSNGWCLDNSTPTTHFSGPDWSGLTWVQMRLTDSLETPDAPLCLNGAGGYTLQSITIDVVPEPYALLLLGVGGLLLVRRIKRA